MQADRFIERRQHAAKCSMVFENRLILSDTVLDSTQHADHLHRNTDYALPMKIYARFKQIDAQRVHIMLPNLKHVRLA